MTLASINSSASERNIRDINDDDDVNKPFQENSVVVIDESWG
jgi:hypothetical protein